MQFKLQIFPFPIVFSKDRIEKVNNIISAFLESYHYQEVMLVASVQSFFELSNTAIKSWIITEIGGILR